MLVSVLADGIQGEGSSVRFNDPTIGFTARLETPFHIDCTGYIHSGGQKCTSTVVGIDRRR